MSEETEWDMEREGEMHDASEIEDEIVERLQRALEESRIRFAAAFLDHAEAKRTIERLTRENESLKTRTDICAMRSIELLAEDFGWDIEEDSIVSWLSSMMQGREKRMEERERLRARVAELEATVIDAQEILKARGEKIANLECGIEAYRTLRKICLVPNCTEPVCAWECEQRERSKS